MFPPRTAAVLLLLSSCATLPPSKWPQDSPISSPPFGRLYPGALEATTLHFVLRGYDDPQLQEVAKLAEEVYQRIMTDTGLYSFKPREQYPITLYGSHPEYLGKTGQPAWSVGVASGNTIFTFSHTGLPSTLAHEMSHLIFHEFMGPSSGKHRWLNEGLAMYEERSDFVARSRGFLKENALPFSRMRELIPQSEEKREVNLWYLQSESVVRFLIERGGKLGFSIFLKQLQQEKNLEEALREGFPGKWNTLEQLEQNWRNSL